MYIDCKLLALQENIDTSLCSLHKNVFEAFMMDQPDVKLRVVPSNETDVV